MAEKSTSPSCCECSKSALAICVTCTRYFCWEHLGQHRQTYEKYLDDFNHPLSNCLNEFEQIENKLHSDINQWENETKNEVIRSADRARRTLDAYLQSYRAHFNEESANFRDSAMINNREMLLNRLEKLQIEYKCSITDLHLVKLYDRGQMLDVETKNATREQVTISGSSQIAPQECDLYVAQTAIGDRIIKEPLAVAAVGSSWAMGGSNDQLLLQEYQKKQITFFNSTGNSDVSMTWHYDPLVSLN